MTAVGVVWLLANGFMLFASSLCLAMWHFGGFKERSAVPTGSSLPVDDLFRFYGTGAALQLAFAITALVCSVALLRLRPWARPAIELLSWLGLVAVTAFTGLLVAAFAATPEPPEARAFVYVVIALSIVSSLVIFVLPLGGTIWLLRRPDSKNAFASANPAA